MKILKRIRLTASALAATSLSSLGLAGIGAASAHATTAPVTAYNGKGFDTCTAPSDAAMDDWYAHSPYHAVGVYLGGSSYTTLACAASSDASDPNHGGYTPSWVAHQSATGWAMWALYSGSQPKDLVVAGANPTALGTSDALDAAANAAKLGFPTGTIIFADVESYTQTTTTPAVVAYLKAFAAQLASSGYKTGVYGTSHGAQSAIGDAVADPALRAALSAVDIANATAGQTDFNATTNDGFLATNLFAQHQRIHQYFLSDSEKYGSTTLSVDADQLDLAPAAQRGVVTRLSGGTREGTAVAVSQRLWPTAPANGDAWQGNQLVAGAAVLSRDGDPADALGGSALAAHVGGPLLLTPTGSLDPSTAAELKRVLAPNSTVYILGGTSAISPAVETAVQKLGFQTHRLGGSDRFATAVDIAQQMASGMRDSTGAPSVQRVLLATGMNFADALAAGTAAGATPDTVMLLTDDTVMPGETATYLKQISGQASGPASATVYPVGGQANSAAKTLGSAVPASNLRLSTSPGTGLVGTDRYNTAQLVARQFFSSTGTPHTFGIATGATWPDALSGGAAMGTLDGPLLLTDTAFLAPPTQTEISDVLPTGSVDGAYVFGGTVAVNDSVLAKLRSLI